ncbi:hypothetical protein [Methylobacterium aquaticum]|uniref:hypothetical protein n=1 Tax=Methylobacterium aquaticum TaxID=270351 RepID=UPI0012E208E8|nr:hypothetical protein [Methylobacterium aquaticum]
MSPDEDIVAIKRFLAAATSASQGKILFLKAESGAGKSTFVHSLEIFLSDKVERVIRLPPQHDLVTDKIPEFIANIPKTVKFTILNFDGREAPSFNEPEYRTFLGALNSLLRTRSDIVIIWPVNDSGFSARVIALLQQIGGKSAFGYTPEYELNGISKLRFRDVVDRILQIANWRLEDAAISDAEVDILIEKSNRIGELLDELQLLIARRFDISGMGVEFPRLVIAISSGSSGIRETCRSLRRADSYYLEASRLLMYTKKSNAAEWWNNRSDDLKAALPYVIAMFDAQLVSVSASAVTHSALYSDDQALVALVEGVRPNKGNANRVISSSEIHKYFMGSPIDNREYGTNVTNETIESFSRIQSLSETHHRAINRSIIGLSVSAGANLKNAKFEVPLVPGLQADVSYETDDGNIVAVEFHHKSARESSANKLAIYILEKLKEYAINFGLASR